MVDSIFYVAPVGPWGGPAVRFPASPGLRGPPVHKEQPTIPPRNGFFKSGSRHFLQDCRGGFAGDAADHYYFAAHLLD